MSDLLQTTSLFSPIGTVLGSSLFRAKGSPSNPNLLQFWLHLAFPEDAWRTPDGKRLKDAVDTLCRQVGGPNFVSLVKRGAFRYPIRKVDPDTLAEKGWPANISSDFNIKSGEDWKPKVVDLNLNPILEASDIYNGCLLRASVSLYGYPAGKSPIPGVGMGLTNAQKTGDGPRLAGSRGDGSEFGRAGGLVPAEDDLDALV